MNNPEWKFRVPQESEVNQDPIEEQFFTTQAIEGISEALVRESIQNSLDAKLPNKTGKDAVVNVRYYFSGQANAQDVHIRKHPFFNGIYYHIFAPDNGLNKQEMPDFSKLTQYLVIEDFNTVGLDGDIDENDNPNTNSPLGHNFYWFWRNVGRSGKKGSELGKWGLGKTVFPAASTINTFFGLTNRYDDNKNYLMGLSVLKTHHLQSEPKTKRYPYGYFGICRNDKDLYFASPTDDEDFIEDFRKTFKLKRGSLNCSGLSIVVPFPRKEISAKSVIRNLLRQYFYPIINGKLNVEITDENDKQILISKDSIFEVLNDLEMTNDYGRSTYKIKKLFELCRWAINCRKEDFVRLNDPPLANATMWKKDWFVNEYLDKVLKTKIEEFDNEQKVAFEVPVKIFDIKQNPKICFFKIFIEKDDNLEEADSFFIRDGITITEVRKPKNKNIRVIVVIEDKDLVQLLGDAENPAHTQWQKESSHFRGKYKDGKEVISFIERSADNICGLLVKPTEGIDRELMKDFFYIDLEEPDKPDKPDKPEKPDDSGIAEITEPPENNTSPSPFIIEKEAGGFRIKNNPLNQEFPANIRVKVAYMRVKGSPLRKYSVYDFDLAKPPIIINQDGVENLSASLNELTFNVNHQKDFVIDIKGFDEQRDLFVKASEYDKEV